jgi:hypothetical protein
MQRRRIVSAIEDDLEKPTQYYIVKDYDRNQFYSYQSYALKPGAKKLYDPYVKAFDRKDAFWKPKYHGQQMDLAVTPSVIAFLMIPLFSVCFFYWESRVRSYKENALGYNLAAPSEFSRP